jgi:hypothetical protein
MRVWLIGAGQAGTEALRQLYKDEEIEVVVTATEERPTAVQQGILSKVDYIDVVNPVNINTLARRIRPDLILLDASAVGNLGRVTGGTQLSQALIYEMAAASDYPCLVLGA